HVDEVAGRLAREGAPFEFGGEERAAVDMDAARGGERAAVDRRERPVAADRIDARGAAGLLVVGLRRRRGEERIARVVPVRDRQVDQVVPVRADEALAPIVEREPELAEAA